MSRYPAEECCFENTGDEWGLNKNRDSDLFNRITSDTGHVLYDLLPPKRNRVPRERGHDFVLTKVKTERFKRAFVNK